MAKVNILMLDMVKAAEFLGFESYGAKGEYEDLIKEVMPAIAHVVYENGLQHYLVIYKADLKKVIIGDPGKGIYKLSRDEFCKIWKEKTVILLKPKFKVYKDIPKHWIHWILEYLKKQENWIYQTIFLGCIYTALGLLTAIFVQRLLDKFIPEKNYDKIFLTGILLMFLLFLRSLAGYFRQKFLIALNKNINIDLNKDFFNHIFRIPKKFFDTRKTGDLTARINDGMKIQQAILLFTNTTFIDGMILIGSFALMFYFSPILSYFTLMIVPLYTILLYTKTKDIKKEQNDVFKSHADVESSYIDSLQGIDDILGFNLSHAFTRYNQNLFEKFQVKIEKLGTTKANISLLNEMFTALFTVLLLCIGTVYVINEKLLLGQMMAAYSLLSNIFSSIRGFINANISLQGANIAVQRLRDILLINPEKNDGKLPFILEKSLTLKNASFSWPKSPPLFHDISIVLKKGEITSLWGPTGSGKSTIVQLLQRKYHLNKGQLLVDNLPADKIDLIDYRRNVSVVPQNIKLFNGTVLENITLGREFSSLDEIIYKIYDFGMGLFLERFEQGLLTMLGEDNRKLSGGEKQILGILRALINYPQVLIIDEGFNALDVETENQIFNTLKEYSKKNIVFIVTHKFKTICKSDYTYLLKDGKIVEKGFPKEVIMKKNSYLNHIFQLENEGMISFQEI